MNRVPAFSLMLLLSVSATSAHALSWRDVAEDYYNQAFEPAIYADHQRHLDSAWNVMIARGVLGSNDAKDFEVTARKLYQWKWPYMEDERVPFFEVKRVATGEEFKVWVKRGRLQTDCNRRTFAIEDQEFAYPGHPSFFHQIYICVDPDDHTPCQLSMRKN